MRENKKLHSLANICKIDHLVNLFSFLLQSYLTNSIVLEQIYQSKIILVVVQSSVHACVRACLHTENLISLELINITMNFNFVLS